jgi:cell wall-associated NlpC family hydrolase
MKLRILLAIVIGATLAAGNIAYGTQSDEDSLGSRMKRLFTGPSPTPRPKHHKKTSPTPKKETPAPHRSPKPSPSPTETPTSAASETPAPTTASPEPVSPSPSATVQPEATSAAPSPVPTRSETPARTPRNRKTQTFEPVRPIGTPPGGRVRAKPSATVEETPIPPPRETPTAKPVASSLPTKPSAPVSTISSAEIVGYDNYSADVRKILDLGLSLTTQNLTYKYNSADPARGGMDCSGFIYYVLTKSGMKDVPRDARDQYIWARKAGKFQAVLSQRDDTFELDALKPGDLLFWAHTYATDRDPDITHTMIYLGREKGTKQRIMVGSSDGRSYKGQQRFGVSVFDFKVARVKANKNGEPGPTFVGYASIPDLPAQ